MSTLAERVRAEAEAAEAEDENGDEAEAEPEPEPEDDEAEAEPEPEPEAHALPPIGPDEIAKAERATQAQRRKLGAILGDAYVAHECLLCSALGFLPELPPVGTTFIVADSEGGLGLEVQPPPVDIPLQAAPDKAMCDECDGYGEVLTGSRAPHGMVAPCSKCAGNGWVMVARSTPLAAAMDGSVPVPPASPPAAPTASAPDAWGRPAGHVHWGVPPAQVQG